MWRKTSIFKRNTVGGAVSIDTSRGVDSNRFLPDSRLRGLDMRCPKKRPIECSEPLLRAVIWFREERTGLPYATSSKAAGTQSRK
jgi:hypothetical protein